MENQFLSIKEFAEAVGITPQGIYKRLKDETDELQHYCKDINGKKYISVSALSAIFKKDYQPQEQEQPTEESSTDKIIEILREQIEAQRQDIAEKNALIDKLVKQLDMQQQLLNQEQQLNYTNAQKILQLESAADKKKRGIFSIFRKKGDAE